MFKYKLIDKLSKLVVISSASSINFWNFNYFLVASVITIEEN